MIEGTLRLLIQGFFFQPQRYAALATLPGDGGAVVLRNDVIASMFAGLIWQKHPLEDLVGEMIDPHGVSWLSDIELSGDELEFDKRYHDHGDTIHYSFILQDGIWVGDFHGARVGRGLAKCITTPASIELFRP